MSLKINNAPPIVKGIFASKTEAGHVYTDTTEPGSLYMRTDVKDEDGLPLFVDLTNGEASGMNDYYCSFIPVEAELTIKDP